MSESYTIGVSLVLAIAIPLAIMKTVGTAGNTSYQSTGGIGKVGVQSTNSYQNTPYQSTGGIGKVGMQSTGATSYKPAYQNRQAAATNNRNSNVKYPRPAARISHSSNVVRY